MMVRRAIATMSVAALLLIPVAGVADEAESVSTKGEILDLACYVAHEAHGEEHAGCAVKCVKGGQPMALKAEDGTVYVLFADHGDASAYENAKDSAGKMVTITGPMSERDGVKGITVLGVKS